MVLSNAEWVDGHKTGGDNKAGVVICWLYSEFIKIYR